MEEVIQELARFLGGSIEEVKKDVEEYSVLSPASIWEKMNPQSPEEVESFYKENDHYLLELISWNYQSPVYYDKVKPLLNQRNKRITDLGGGIGSLCIILSYAGNDLTLVEINPTLQRFAKQRFTDRLLKIPIYPNLRKVKDQDIIVAIDFFEHIHPDRLPSLLKECYGSLRDGGYIYDRSTYGQQDIFPMHYDHSQYIAVMMKEAGFNKRTNGDWVKGGQSYGVQLGIPVLGHIDKELFFSVAQMKKPTGTKMTLIDNKPADKARDEIVAKLEKDWVFFMDGDQTFPSDCLNKLLSWDLPIVSGVYFKSPGNPVPHVYSYAWQDNSDMPKDEGHLYKPEVWKVVQVMQKYQDILKESDGNPAIVLPTTHEDLFEIDGCGGGCLLVHRKVFEAIEPPYFRYSRDKEGSETWNGEDFYFCRKVKEAGFKIYCDAGVLCGHRMKGLIGWNHFLSWVDPKVTPYPWGEEPREAEMYEELKEGK